MLKQIKTAAATLFGSSHVRSAQRQEAMTSTLKPQTRLASRARGIAFALGAGLLGLVLAAPVSWAQLGGVDPTPSPEPAPSTVATFEVSIIAPENGQAVGSDCFRLNLETGAFSADVLSANGFPDGHWFAVSDQNQSSALFTAYMTALAVSSDGQPVPVTYAFGGRIDQSGAMGAIVLSDGTPLAYQGQVNPNCSVSAGASAVARSSVASGFDAAVLGVYGLKP